MRVVTTAVHAYVLAGDGPRDLRVLKAAAEKCNRSKVLRATQEPIRRA